jgi:hypothetical protein
VVSDEGRLDDSLDIADLVQELGQRCYAGWLLLERDGAKVAISVDGGRMAFASSSDPDHRLGPMLLRRGAITLRQMEDAVREQAPGKRFGATLVEKGFLEPQDLVRGVVDQTRQIILHAFRWTSGSYRLQQGIAAGEDITLDISTPQLVLDGISQIDSWSRILRGCGGLDAVYTPVAGSEALFRQLTLDVDQAALLRSVKEPRPLEALCAESVLNHFEVCRNLWAFRVIGLIRRNEPSDPLDEDGLEFVFSNPSP